ncbi:stage II sporulation protein R [Caloranaerobacter azorensis DSM 13643]|uniref:Stage II sporulation protein R n=1 Tax=Caloranaerobacter azorensis DSM 13643 TaxID=1121264 RepID=A0A1M5ST00_9FIRM|nr:stage II sporulation protein R [Caloranaerobacter azorensis]SHH41418.1 stage II sporulation protein R [Caloranaerobacter azorensis DSM 13643]
MIRYKKILSFALVFVLLIVSGIVFLSDVYKNRESYKNKLIRFHVIANSDSPEDQQLKLKVRDKIIKEMNSKFEKASSLDESKKIILDNLDTIEYIAEKQIRELGKNYDVSVKFGEYDFPTKSYGNFTLPAGKYQAVRVVIGDGKGKNWWCVMFPPLCFIDITHGITNDKIKEELKGVLTEEEYNMIVNANGNKEIPLKLKFKVVELLEKSKLRFAKMLVGLGTR